VNSKEENSSDFSLDLVQEFGLSTQMSKARAPVMIRWKNGRKKHILSCDGSLKMLVVSTAQLQATSALYVCWDNAISFT
jgi:hypothetical protein